MTYQAPSSGRCWRRSRGRRSCSSRRSSRSLFTWACSSFLQTPSTQTITLLPSFFVSEFSDDQTKVVASAVITAIPETIAYLCLQRLFERGLTAGALK